MIARTTRKPMRSTSSSGAGRSSKPAPKRTQRNSASKRRVLGKPQTRTAQTRAPKTSSQGRQSAYRKKTRLAPPAKGAFRIIPIGGCEEVGRNMTIFEYGNDIIILDIGLQFPDEDMPGIDYIVPNVKYLKGKEKNIRGVVFTHGHLDHIGAAPLVLEQLGYPPIIAMPLTLAMLKHKQEDYKKGTSKFLKTITIKSIKDKVKLGAFTVSPFQVEHSIMDSMGVVIETPVGSAIHPGDWTMERDKEGITHVHYRHLSKLKGPTVLMLESLGATKTGRHSTYEEMYENLQDVLSAAPGRIILATFSSQVERVKWILQAAEKLGKKVALDGYSMKMNIEIAKKLGYIKISKSVLIDASKIDNYDDNKVVVVCTGAQGEERAVLNRITNGDHRTIKLRKKDTVIFSASIIPGNERSIQRMKDNIYRQCDHVVHGDVMDVHISGHANRADIVDILEQIRPNYFMPVYANHYFLKEARNLAISQGFPDKNIIVPDNGSIIDLDRKGIKVQKEKAPSDYVFVDGLGVSDSQHVVLRDRQVLAEDGMLVVIATIQSKTGKLVQNPDIISRGFVFLKDNKKLIEDIRHKVKSMVIASDPLSWADTNQIRNNIRDKVGQFVFSKTQKRPMILPVVIEV